MADITSKTLIMIKGVLFLVIIAGCSALLLLRDPTLTAAATVCVLIWASARFYYFLFYVLERHVDPGLRYAGLIALTRALLKRAVRRRQDG